MSYIIDFGTSLSSSNTSINISFVIFLLNIYLLLISKLILFIFSSLNEFFFVDSLSTEVSVFLLEFVFNNEFFMRFFFSRHFLNVFIYYILN